MNTLSRHITGTVTVILGLSLILINLSDLVTLLYGIAILVIGAFIFFNKKEDDIEKIKGGQE